MLIISLLLQTFLVPDPKCLLKNRKQQQFLREKAGCKAGAFKEDDSVSTSKVVCVQAYSMSPRSLPSSQFIQYLFQSPAQEMKKSLGFRRKRHTVGFSLHLKSNWIFTFTSGAQGSSVTD